MSKTLVAYFSRSGNNYVNGNIVNLKVGNTEVVASKIKDKIDCDVFKIQPAINYSEDYTKSTEEAMADQKANARPELTEYLGGIDSYEEIILAYPNYWGTMPMAVFTFLDHYDFTGKTIKPLCTHEGSGMGRSEADIKALCPDATVTKGLAIKGGSVSGCDDELGMWL